MNSQLYAGQIYEGAPGPQRQAASAAVGVGSLPSQEHLSQIVQLAAEICGVPIGALSFMDESWQTVLACVGVKMEQVPREATFCTHTLAKGELMLVEDTMRDVRFIGHPMVTGDPEIRFYAGLPIVRPGDRTPVGTLCVVDVKPRVLSQTQQSALRALASQFETRLELLRERGALLQAMAERDRATETLTRREALFRAFLENGPLLTYMKDEESRLLFYNKRVAEQFRVTQTEWLGRSDEEVFPVEQAHALREHDLLALASRGVIETEEIVGEGDERRCYMSYKFSCEDGTGRRMLAGMSIDVTEQRRREQELHETREELEKVTKLDELTGLPTRRVLDQHLDAEYLKTVHGRRSLALMIVDMDHFAQRNERMGEAAGDEALRRVAEVLRGCVAETDIAVRYGADEFTVLMPETTVDEARAMAERLQRELRHEDWGLLPLSVSIGIAGTQHAVRSARQLFCFADEAMYRAKDSGRNRVVVYAPR